MPLLLIYRYILRTLLSPVQQDSPLVLSVVSCPLGKASPKGCGTQSRTKGERSSSPLGRFALSRYVPLCFRQSRRRDALWAFQTVMYVIYSRRRYICLSLRPLWGTAPKGAVCAVVGFGPSPLGTERKQRGRRIVGFGPSPLGTESPLGIYSGTKALWAYIAGVAPLGIYWASLVSYPPLGGC